MAGTPTARRGNPTITAARTDTPDVTRDVNALAAALDDAPVHLPPSPIALRPANPGKECWHFATDTLVFSYYRVGVGWTDVNPANAGASVASLRKLGTGANDATAGNDARLSDARVPTTGSVSLSKLAAGVGGRLLGAFDLIPFAIGANGNVTLASNSITHNAKGGVAIVVEFIRHTSGGVAAASAFRLKRGGVTQKSIAASVGVGSSMLCAGAFSFGSLSGAQVWDVSVDLGNVPVTVANEGTGVLAIFEQY
jgi:hypothetical protein